MWICLNNSFLSIVRKDCRPDELLVRARRNGDIEKAFPGAKVEKTPFADYLYRAVVPETDVQQGLAAAVTRIDYPNFKNSVKGSIIHQAYAKVWGVMYGLQRP